MASKPRAVGDQVIKIPCHAPLVSEQSPRAAVEPLEHLRVDAAGVIHLGHDPASNHEHLDRAAVTVGIVGSGAVPKQRVENQRASCRRADLQFGAGAELGVAEFQIVGQKALTPRHQPRGAVLRGDVIDIEQNVDAGNEVGIRDRLADVVQVAMPLPGIGALAAARRHR